jgi:hypothetical protein
MFAGGSDQSSSLRIIHDHVVNVQSVSGLTSGGIAMSAHFAF